MPKKSTSVITSSISLCSILFAGVTAGTSASYAQFSRTPAGSSAKKSASSPTKKIQFGYASKVVRYPKSLITMLISKRCISETAECAFNDKAQAAFLVCWQNHTTDNLDYPRGFDHESVYTEDKKIAETGDTLPDGGVIYRLGGVRINNNGQVSFVAVVITPAQQNMLKKGGYYFSYKYTSSFGYTYKTFPADRMVVMVDNTVKADSLAFNSSTYNKMRNQFGATFTNARMVLDNAFLPGWRNGTISGYWLGDDGNPYFFDGGSVSRDLLTWTRGPFPDVILNTIQGRYQMSLGPGQTHQTIFYRLDNSEAFRWTFQPGDPTDKHDGIRSYPSPFPWEGSSVAVGPLAVFSEPNLPGYIRDEIIIPKGSLGFFPWTGDRTGGSYQRSIALNMKGQAVLMKTEQRHCLWGSAGLIYADFVFENAANPSQPLLEFSPDLTIWPPDVNTKGDVLISGNPHPNQGSYIAAVIATPKSGTVSVTQDIPFSTVLTQNFQDDIKLTAPPLQPPPLPSHP